MDKNQIISQIEKNVKACKKCRLCEHAKNPVPGEGNINSEIIFIGEAPGQVEDETGRPFVGRAGKLLESLLNEIGYKRSDVWIGNIIKHRPPENRDPLPDELSACEPYLTAQIQVISPLLIVTLGRFSMNYFYPDGKITRDRANVIKIKGFSVYPVYHPAAALRNPTMAKTLKQDFMKIPDVLKNIKSGGGGVGGGVGNGRNTEGNTGGRVGGNTDDSARGDTGGRAGGTLNAQGPSLSVDDERAQIADGQLGLGL